MLIKTSKNCTHFITSQRDGRLAQLILEQENRSMGSGGYAMEKLKGPDGAIDISFVQLDYGGSPKNHAFIKDGQIWATHMSGWLIDLLRKNELDFTTEQIESPDFIVNYMWKLIRADGNMPSSDKLG